MNDRVRVLFFFFRLVRGGAQENTLANLAELDPARWESSLATGPALGPEGSLEDRCLQSGVRMLRIPELVRELSPKQDLLALRRLTFLCRKERPDIVHTHTSKAGILGRIAARRAGVPIVVHTPHGHVFHSYESRWRTRLFVALEQFCAGKADRLVALTENERREHLELQVGRQEQWVTIHSGVDFGPFQPELRSDPRLRAEWQIPAEARVVGTVGRLVPIKGQSFLLEAFSQMAKGDPKLHLLLVGDGPLREDLLAQARALGLCVVDHMGGSLRLDGSPTAPRVHFLGLRKDVARCMAVMDLFVLPSLNEGMGRVLVEAMAMSLPCIGSRVSGIPDVIVEGETGLLVPARDSEALATAIGALLNDEARSRRMGELGRDRVVPEWGQARMIEKLDLLYRELLAARGVDIPRGRPTIELQASEGRR